MGGIFRQIRKFGKRFSFPSAPSIWICQTVESIEFLQDRRPKTKILFPFQAENDYCASKKFKHYNHEVDDEEYYSPCTNVVWGNSSSGSGSGSKKKNDMKLLFCSPTYSYSTLRRFLATLIPAYPDTINKMVAEWQSHRHSTRLEIGKPFDIISLLSSKEMNYLVRSNGDRVEVESLRGKNIMVCCVFVPVFWKTIEAAQFRVLPYVCSKPFSGDCNYEVVVVPKMRVNCDNDRDAFDHFLLGLPSTWLAIPFSDSLRRDCVCKALGLVVDPICLFFDENQKLLLQESLGGCDSSLFHTESCIPWWKTHSQLDAILDCRPSDCLYQIGPGSGTGTGTGKVSISELNEKLVGVYLCKDGSFLRTLYLVYQECKARSMDFEIVLVYLPNPEWDNVDPHLFQGAINHVLHKLNTSITWWVLPFDCFKNLKLRQHCKSYMEDELIIVGPHNKFVDPYGKHVISNFGFNAYPFTREHVVEKEYEEIRALTLESLLGNRPIYRHYYIEVSVKELLGKPILLYVDHALSLNHNLYFPLLYWYLHSKRTRGGSPDFEVVFVDLDDGDASLQMPWLSCAFDSQHTTFIINKLLKGRHAVLVLFGKDGQILSLDAQDLLETCPDGFQSYKGLRNDVIKSIQNIYSINGAEMHDMCDSIMSYELC